MHTSLMTVSQASSCVGHMNRCVRASLVLNPGRENHENYNRQGSVRVMCRTRLLRNYQKQGDVG